MLVMPTCLALVIREARVTRIYTQISPKIWLFWPFRGNSAGALSSAAANTAEGAVAETSAYAAQICQTEKKFIHSFTF